MKKIRSIGILVIGLCLPITGCESAETNCCHMDGKIILKPLNPPKVEEKITVIQPAPPPAPTVTVIQKFQCGKCRKFFVPTPEHPTCQDCSRVEEIVIVNPPVQQQYYQTPVYQPNQVYQPRYGQVYQESPGYFAPSYQFPPNFCYSYESRSSTSIHAGPR